MNGNTAGFKGNTKEDSLVTKTKLNGCFLRKFWPLSLTHKKGYWLYYHCNYVPLFKSLCVAAWSQRNRSIPPRAVTHAYILVCLRCAPPLNFKGFDLSAGITTLGSLFYCHCLPTPLPATSCFIHISHGLRRRHQPHCDTPWHSAIHSHSPTVYVAYWWRIEEKHI